MRTEVRFHTSAQPGMVVWRQSLGRTEAERAGAYPIHLQALIGRLAEHQGQPPETVREVDGDRVFWWMRYTDRVRVQFVLGEVPRRPRGWWDWRRRIDRVLRPAVRVVTVLRVQVVDS